MKRALIVAAAVLLLCALGTYIAARSMLASDLVRLRLEQQLSARLGRPVRIGSASATILPGIALDLGDVSIGEPESLHVRRVRVLTGFRALFSDTIDIREVRVLDGRPGGAAPAFTFDCDASMLGDRLDVRALTLRGATSRIEARGTLTSIANLEGTFEAASDLLDLNELIAIGAALAPPRGARGAPGSGMHLAVRLTTPKVRFGTYEFDNLSTTIDAITARVVLKPLSVRLFEGTFTGRLDADTGEAPPVLRLTGALKNLDVVDLLKQTGAAGGLTGRVSGNLSLVAQGADGESMLRTARGTIAAVIANGSLPHLDMIRSVVLAFGKPSPGAQGGSGTSFESLSGTLALSGGTLRSDNLSLHSRDLDMHGAGTLVLSTGAVDARADVVLSSELTAQAGSDLRRYAQQDGRVVVPATVGGTLARPSVFIDLADAAKRALGNELQRRAKDFLGGLFKKKKKGGG